MLEKIIYGTLWTLTILSIFTLFGCAIAEIWSAVNLELVNKIIATALLGLIASVIGMWIATAIDI